MKSTEDHDTEGEHFTLNGSPVPLTLFPLLREKQGMFLPRSVRTTCTETRSYQEHWIRLCDTSRWTLPVGCL